jgi:hypothetical protein
MSRPTTLREWARTQAPHLDVVTSSVPEPVLVGHTLVAVFDDSQRARELVLAWERIEPADGGVGTVVLGTAPDRQSELDRDTGVDPEGVTEYAIMRALKGAIPGAVVGALLVAVIVVLLDGWSSIVIGAALGGAAFGAVPGGVLAFTSGTGWGSAYRHTFVDDDATSVVFASIHSEDPARIEAALEAASDVGARTYRVDADGSAEQVRTDG